LAPPWGGASSDAFIGEGALGDATIGEERKDLRQAWPERERELSLAKKGTPAGATAGGGRPRERELPLAKKGTLAGTTVGGGRPLDEGGRAT
jgi:hypothetical protein